MAKIRTSFALSQDALTLLNKLSEKLGVSMAAIVEMSVRDKAVKENIKVK